MSSFYDDMNWKVTVGLIMQVGLTIAIIIVLCYLYVL